MSETYDFSNHLKNKLSEKYIRAIGDPSSVDPDALAAMQEELYRRYQVNNPEDLDREIEADGLNIATVRALNEVDYYTDSPGYHHPFKTGWSLAFQCLPQTLKISIPVAAMAALSFVVMISVGAEGGSHFLLLLMPLLYACGVAAVAISLTNHYRGVSENTVMLTLERIIPWAVTWVLVIICTLAGFLLFVIPGYIVAVRLFWADEYAVGEGLNPFAAVAKSWEVTRDFGMKVFLFQFYAGFANIVVILPTYIIVFVTMVLMGDHLASIDQSVVLQLLVFTFLGTVGLVCYSFLHGPELAYFYGLRALKEGGERPE